MSQCCVNADLIILTIIPGGSLARLALAPPLQITMLQQCSTNTRNTKQSEEQHDETSEENCSRDHQTTHHLTLIPICISTVLLVCLSDSRTHLKYEVINHWSV